MKRSHTTLLLLAFSALLACTGLAVTHRTAESSSAYTPEVGSYMLEQTDLLGRTVTVPVEFDGERYILADYTRNIFVYNAALIASQREMTRDKTYMNSYRITSKDGVFTDAKAISLYYNVVTAYDFYSKENIGVDYKGLNGKNDDIAGNWKENGEIPLYLFPHFNAGDYRYNAAFFEENGEGYIFSGDGDPNNTLYNIYNQTASLDIIAHEYQHGITHFMDKDLEYISETGALDEAIADIFGMIIENKDPNTDDFWNVGEDCTVTDRVNRSIKYPSKIHPNYRTSFKNKWACPLNHYSNHDVNCDFGGVHYNSTIISHLQYTAWEVSPQIFTREVIGKLWFDALVNMPRRASFSQFVETLRRSAKNNFDEHTFNALEYSLSLNGYTNDVYHKVTVTDEDGAFLLSLAVPDGATPNVPTPVKQSTAQFDYVFTGFTQTIGEITEDCEFTASFSAKIREYSIVYITDGKERRVSAEYGSAFEQVPEGFDGWYLDETYTLPLEETAVTGDITLYARSVSSPIPWLWIGLGAGVVLIGALTAILILKKKSSK